MDPYLYLEFINKASEIHDYLTGKVSDYLGIYTYKINNVEHTQPAIFVVEHEDEERPEEWAVEPNRATGFHIEILILPPAVTAKHYLMATGLNEIYQIKAIQHGRSKNLYEAKAALVVSLPYFREKSHLPKNRQDKEELNLIHTQTSLGP